MMQGTISTVYVPLRRRVLVACALYACMFGIAAVAPFQANAQAQQPPSAETLPATGVAETSVTLHGRVNPNGERARYRFEWGAEPNGLSNWTGWDEAGSGTVFLNFDEFVPFLRQNTTHYFRIVARDWQGTQFSGATLSFRTLPVQSPTPSPSPAPPSPPPAPQQVPSVETRPATNVTQTSAILHGDANPNGLATRVYFEYAPLAGGPILRTPDQNIGAGNQNVSFSASVSPLVDNTTYYVRVVGVNDRGTSFGSILNFTTGTIPPPPPGPVQSPPAVQTRPATNVTQVSAMLQGDANPNGLLTNVHFEYAQVGGSIFRTPDRVLGLGNTSVSFSESISGLIADTNYYFRAVGTNERGMSFGPILYFTTTNIPIPPPQGQVPAVQTRPATNVTQVSAVLNADANPNGLATAYYFEYAAVNGQVLRTPERSLGSGNTSVSFSESVSSLTSNTNYYFRAIATNSRGTTFGPILYFTTTGISIPQGQPPVTETYLPTGITQVSATLNGGANPNGSATSFHFEYAMVGGSISSTPTRALGSGNAISPVSDSVTNLEPGRTYYFRSVAVNTYGTTFGTIINFTTATLPNPQGQAPAVETRPATNVTQFSAVLRGDLNSNGAPTTYRFEYARIGGAIFTTQVRSAGLGSGNVAVSEPIGGLEPNISYYFRLIGESIHGTTYGPILLFTTLSFPATPPPSPSPAPEPPAVETQSATNIVETAATLRGSVNPRGSTASYWFEYGTTPSLGLVTARQTAGSGSQAIAASQSLSALTAGTSYYFRVAAENAQGITRGATLSFTTLSSVPQGIPPTVRTFSATGVTQNAATVRGEVNPERNETTYWFEYGTNASLGTRTASTGVGNGSQAVSVSVPLSGLSANTVYYFRVVAENSYGRSFGLIETFVTPQSVPPSEGNAPVAETNAATNITQTTATFPGRVNPNGAQTTYYFEYGFTSSFGQTTATQSAGSGNGFLTLSSGVSGLNSNATYYFRIVATNQYGISRGATLSFTTLSSQNPNPPQSANIPPTVETLSASGVGANEATLRGRVNPNGSDTQYRFEWGTSPNGLSNMTGWDRIGGGTSFVELSEFVPFLHSNETNYFRIVGRNAFGIVNGQLLTFTTRPSGQQQGSASFVETQTPTGVSQTSATLRARVNPNGSNTNYRFEYGLTSSFGNTTGDQSIGSGSTFLDASNFVSGLNQNATYYFRAVATNSFGTSYGSTFTFTTSGGSGNAPFAQTNGATSVTGTSAVLNGQVNPNGFSTTYRFEYGETSSLGQSTVTQSAGSGSSNLSVSLGIAGLIQNRTYYFRIVAESQYGTVQGSLLSFVTTSGGGGSGPSVETLSVFNTSENGVTLRGRVNPNDAYTTVWFEYGTTATLGSATGFQAIGSGNYSQEYTAALTSLNPNTTYYFRAVGTNSGGTVYGSTLTFATSGNYGSLPNVETRSPSLSSANSATLQGMVNPNGSFTTAWFEYGINPGLLTSTSPSISIGSSYSSTVFSRMSDYLTPGTVYYVRAVARNQSGTAYGQTISFTTTGSYGGVSVPVVTTRAASVVGTQSALLNGDVNPQGGATSAWFEYGLTASLGLTTVQLPVGAGTSFTPYSSTLTVLLSNATYFFRSVAQNPSGIAYGSILSFRTAPTVISTPTPTPTPAPTPRPLPILPTPIRIASCIIVNADLTSYEPNPGDAFTYLFTYRNECDAEFTNVSLAIVLPEGVTFSTSNLPLAGRTDDRLTYGIGSILPHSQSVVTIEGTVGNDLNDGTVLTFGGLLTVTDKAGITEVVSTYVTAVVGGAANGAFFASVFDLFRNIFGNWVVGLGLLLALLAVLYFAVWRKRGSEPATERLTLARTLPSTGH